jgi:anti-sigma factor RsiW
MANTENIEAKLAAYVDGELDASERAEIEQHLAANPQHRKLIEELRVARQYLRQLPREQAPPDVAEALNAQLRAGGAAR